jgi:hypothetical protein
MSRALSQYSWACTRHSHFMETTTVLDTDGLAAAYAASVEHEREAWQALHALPPGSPQRSAAWDEWSAAIVATNRAWRRLNTSRIGHPAAGAPRSIINHHAAA